MIALIVGWFLLLNQIVGLQFSLEPVGLALNQPEKAENLISILFEKQQFQALYELLQTRAFDYGAIYCRVWAHQGSLAKAQEILQKADNDWQRALLNPNCLMCSRMLLTELRDPENLQFFSQLPVSFMEAANFKASLFSADSFDAILTDSLKRHLRNRQMRWFDWLDDQNLGSLPHLNRLWQLFYEENGWLFVAPSMFAEASEPVKKILLEWLLPVKVRVGGEEELLLRRLAFYACSQSVIFEGSINWEIWNEILMPDELEFTEDSLMSLIRSLKSAHLNLYGDWIVEILMLWRPVLNELSDAEMKELLEFLFLDLSLTMRGTCKLLQTTADSRIFEFIRGRESEEFLILLSRECPEIPQLQTLPLQSRWETLVRGLRTEASNGNRCFNSAYSRIVYLSENRMNVQCFPKSRADVQLILEAMIQEKWFNLSKTGTRTPNGRMPRLFARFLGFYALLARVYGMNEVLRLDSSFLATQSPISTITCSADEETFCQFDMSVDGTPQLNPEMSLSPLLAMMPSPRDSYNFNCYSKNDQYILETNMQSEFNVIVLSPELLAYSPQSTIRSLLQCEHDALIYQELLKQEFEKGLELHRNSCLFSAEELRMILAT